MRQQKSFGFISGSFLRRQLMIANYRVKKFVRKISVIKTNSFDWELLTFDDIKKVVHFGIFIHKTKTKVFVKVGLCLL